MTTSTDDTGAAQTTTLVDSLTELMRLPAEMAQAMIGAALPAMPEALAAAMPETLTDPAEAAQWAEAAGRLQAMWLDFQSKQMLALTTAPTPAPTPAEGGAPKSWLDAMAWIGNVPGADPRALARFWGEGMAIWSQALALPGGEGTPPGAPPADKRFAAPQWHEQPFFAARHRSYLLFAERALAMAEAGDGVAPDKREQLRFATRMLVDALSPDHFPQTNPLVIERAIVTRGQSLVKGMEHLLADIGRGQLTHSDPGAFSVGVNIAVTPGKVVYETPLFQLIHYTPVTEKVRAVPLVIFPPWINRFYILDLNAKKSFVRWAVAQGVSTFMVSWKSADASNEGINWAEVVWDDYIAAQIEAIDEVRRRLKVPAVHTIGYCVAGTTLAATLAVLARRGEAETVKTATFFTAQVDFEKAGDLKNFVDDQQIAALEALAPEGFLDGRYMAATFNLLRGQDLIWNYAINHYLLGEDYKPFDLLYWNGDTTNLPIRWHTAYLRDLYRDNQLVVPDALSALGTPIDLTRITTPCFIQAGREDHIAPPESVWRFTRLLARAPWRFVLAGSGHIAGVVNPPGSGKYGYWTNPSPGDTLDSFIAGASTHQDSWWPHWLAWLVAEGDGEVAARGPRIPGGPGNRALEDAPGRYVKMR